MPLRFKSRAVSIGFLVKTSINISDELSDLRVCFLGNHLVHQPIVLLYVYIDIKEDDTLIKREKTPTNSMIKSKKKMIKSKKTPTNSIKPTKQSSLLTELRKQSSLLTELRRVDQHQNATGHSDGSDSYSEECEQSELLLRRRLEPTSQQQL
jgi:hypothetical protein